MEITVGSPTLPSPPTSKIGPLGSKSLLERLNLERNPLSAHLTLELSISQNEGEMSQSSVLGTEHGLSGAAALECGRGFGSSRGHRGTFSSHPPSYAWPHPRGELPYPHWEPAPCR